MSERATLEEVHEFANKVREAGGGNPIDALMPAVPQDQTACLIAKNLNFNCSVVGVDTDFEKQGWDYSRWVMELTDRDVRDKIAASLDLPTAERPGSRWDAADVFYAVLLPERIGAVAAAFDATGDVVDGVLGQLDDALYDEFDIDITEYDPSNAKQKAVFERVVNEELENLTDAERQDVREMLPLIVLSTKEAYSLATYITAEGKIVL